MKYVRRDRAVDLSTELASSLLSQIEASAYVKQCYFLCRKLIYERSWRDQFNFMIYYQI